MGFTRSPHYTALAEINVQIIDLCRKLSVESLLESDERIQVAHQILMLETDRKGIVLDILHKLQTETPSRNLLS